MPVRGKVHIWSVRRQVGLNALAEEGVNSALRFVEAGPAAARSFSPSPTARVHGQQPIER
jgi:hypothetical protein